MRFRCLAIGGVKTAGALSAPDDEVVRHLHMSLIARDKRQIVRTTYPSISTTTNFFPEFISRLPSYDVNDDNDDPEVFVGGSSTHLDLRLALSIEKNYVVPGGRYSLVFVGFAAPAASALRERLHGGQFYSRGKRNPCCCESFVALS